ncbi:MAG: YjfB family protein [Zoogloeaceae bacterium]|nr:YjfB family protein [Zoogloeaceae bacterium]
MDVSSIAAFASANAQFKVQSEASMLMLKKALDMQQQNAALLLQALPQVPPTGGAEGAIIDTWA